MTGGPGSVPCPTIARDISVGAQGTDVSQLQSYLSSNGFLSASSTGFFGPMTAHALAQFQKAMGLATSTGFFGPLTRNFINGRCGGYGEGGRNGTSTPPMWPGLHASSTSGMWGNGSGSAGGGSNYWSGNPPATTTSRMPCMQPYSPPSDTSGSGAAGTNVIMMRPCGGAGGPPPGQFWNSSSTSQTPCSQSSLENGSSVAAVAAALFMPHAILPGMNGSPCPDGPDVGGASAGGQSGTGN
jgi:peptidoglycan hydrolase-like protein with peptidoglycan-binding domain